MTKLHELSSFGQAVWFDFIRRRILENGELADLVTQGVRGVTSNPSIFEKAIAGSSDYDTRIEKLTMSGLEVEEIYEALAVEDIIEAANILRPVYGETYGVDGYVSLEVSPRLAHDTETTVSEALRLFKLLGKPNAMIKVPATPAGIPAIERLIAAGVNINATLIFSVAAYEAVAEAYVAGIEKLVAEGGDPAKVASVASIFVSRIDTALEKELAAKDALRLSGKIAVDNSKLAYAGFKRIFSGERWEKLAKAGARVQRPLWASTGTKNPEWPETLYVDTLIGPHTVNTLPPATLNAFLSKGTVASTVETDVDGSRERLAELAKLGIDLNAVTDRLLAEGVKSFSDAFDTLLASVALKRARFSGRGPVETFGNHKAAVEAEFARMKRERVVGRIWEHDFTLWSDTPVEVENRLGWLDVSSRMKGEASRLDALLAALLGEGIDKALLIGMGGSSLAPEVLAKTFPEAKGLALSIADSTVPEAISKLAAEHDPATSVFVVSTKSGGTVETLSLFKYFYRMAVNSLGAEKAGSRFVIITDPGSALEKIGREIGAREIFLNDPNIGGRYAALSLVGLVPAALIGIDLARLFAVAAAAMEEAKTESVAARLGCAMGALAKAGMDKLTLLCSPEIASFADWVEQLVAESTGKCGKGIVPIAGEKPGNPSEYGHDRFFVALTVAGDDTFEQQLAMFEALGHPTLRFNLADTYGIAAHFHRWAFATAVASWSLGVQPFNQPDVESAKVVARAMLKSYQETGKMDAGAPACVDGGVEVFTAAPCASAGEALAALLKDAGPGDYVAIQSYLARSEETDEAMESLRAAIRKRTRAAVTTGYGPRFLHSTGQLHKGDSGRGRFLQITASDEKDLPIPDGFDSDRSSATFGAVKLSQVLGDAGALTSAGRKVLRLNVSGQSAASVILSLAGRVNA